MSLSQPLRQLVEASLFIRRKRIESTRRDLVEQGVEFGLGRRRLLGVGGRRRRCAPRPVDDGRGVASLAAIEGAARNQAYAATKGGLISMLKAIAVESARYGIRANAILPGWIATDMTEAAQNTEVFQSKVISRVPIRRWGEPKDFGGVAVYLASEAAAYHTGGTFVIDGGYSIF